jgi:predicted nuclease with TOPRIM domain
MDTLNTAEETPEKENKGRGLIILLIFLVAAFAALSGYLYVQLNTIKKESEALKAQTEQAGKDIDEYRAQLQELTAKYDSLMQAHEGLKAELGAERDKVVALMRDYERLKANGGSPDSPAGKGMKARLEELQQAYDENEAIIADLKAKNQELTNENFKAAKQLEELNAQNSKLTQENSKLSKTVDIAKRLKTYEVYADAVRVSGTKEKVVTKASKADRLRVCFTVLDNQIADKQEKAIYAVIKDPNKKTFTTGDRSKITLLNGDEIPYSVKKDIFYDNKVMQLCLNWEVVKEEKLQPGKYIVQIYSDGVQIGETEFELK